MGPQLQRFSTDVSRSLNRTRFTLATKQLARSASERACYWTGNDTTNLLASVRELNEVVTKTPRDELQTLMPTVFSPLSKAINHEEVEVRKVVVLVRHPAFPIPPCDLSASVAHTGSAIDGVWLVCTGDGSDVPYPRARHEARAGEADRRENCLLHARSVRI